MSLCMCRRHRRFWHATLGLRSAIHRHHPPQKAVLSQICCFGEREVVLVQILLDGAEPRDAGTIYTVFQKKTCDHVFDDKLM